ncbi:MAG: lysophospholipid acyltransferase family protein [Candidatus Omnitrophica bacterium]|nr:lysophospholipid acyltransferase family protein [Candidatus Omnitrophota bacterium]
MIFYLLYRIGSFLALRLPVTVSYRIACMIADVYQYVSEKDRDAVLNNLKTVLGNESHSDEELTQMAKEVFRNFAKYLVDFFRFSKVDHDYIRRFVKIEGLNNIDEARSRGKGAILLSAHIGNWELGGFVLAMIGYPISAVVLTHQNKKINDFFTHQRLLSNLKPIEIGIALRSCYAALKGNNLLAVLGDRDFSKNGIHVDFFGRKTLLPKGPSVFSRRIGSAIVPTFMIREKDDSFRLIMDKPIFPDASGEEDKAIETLTKKYLSVIEAYVRKYPTQWYMFREVWNNNDKKFLRPDTII